MKQNARDPYRVLGISRDATAEEIRSGYLRLVWTLHPDSSQRDDGTAARRLAEARVAYQRLADPAQRATLDAKMRASTQRASRPEPTVPIPPATTSSEPPVIPSHVRAAKVADKPFRSDIRQRPGGFCDSDPLRMTRDNPVWHPRRLFARLFWSAPALHLLFVLVLVFVALLGCLMMGTQTAPMLGAAMLVAAPSVYYAVDRITA